MGVSVNITAGQLKQAFSTAQDIIREEMITGLAYLGEQCVTRIRDGSHGNDWMDQTGNLRSSIGYAVYKFGEQQFASAFESVKEGSSGSEKGRKYIEELAREYAKTYALVVVAGMDYAEYVEATSRDVLAGTELWAKAEMEKVLNVYKGRAERRINALFAKLL